MNKEKPVTIPMSFVEKRHQILGEEYLDDITKNGFIADKRYHTTYAGLQNIFKKHEVAFSPNLDLMLKSSMAKPDVEPSQEEEAGFKTIALNTIKAIKENTQSGFKRVTEDDHKKRSDICNNCEYWLPNGYYGIGKCRRCGCSGIKLWMEVSKCPIGKW